MKVISNKENEVKFDNGLTLFGYHSQDCCEENYLDFDQLPVGTELPDLTATEFVAAISLKKDGFTVKDAAGLPKWVQARSSQNGYYGDGVDLVVADGSIELRPKRPGADVYNELFSGRIDG